MNFYGWLDMSLASIRKTHRFGGVTFVDRGSVEPYCQQQWLIEEYRRFGLRSDPIPQKTVQRMHTEGCESDGIVVPSQLVAESYLKAGFSQKKIFVNPLGVDSEQYAPRPIEKSSDRLKFVFIGQLSIQKGLPDLLKAWKKMNSLHAELILAGIIPPQERSVITPLLHDAKNIQWKGHCNNIPSLLRECDVLLLPSAQDGFGLVVLEAFACGLPVIVSSRVGAKDCVQDGITGRIFEFGNSDQLTDCLHTFTRNSTLSHQMYPAVLKTAREFSWTAYGARLVKIITSSCYPNPYDQGGMCKMGKK